MVKLRAIIIILLLFFISCEDKEIKVEPKSADFSPKNVKIIERNDSTEFHLSRSEREKPVKIKLKRDSKGNYSWEINGENAEDIINADKSLKKSLIRDGDRD
jgi:hypothetical protein